MNTASFYLHINVYRIDTTCFILTRNASCIDMRWVFTEQYGNGIGIICISFLLKPVYTYTILIYTPPKQVCIHMDSIV